MRKGGDQVLRTRKCLPDLVRLVRALRYLRQVAPWDMSYYRVLSASCVMLTWVSRFVCLVQSVMLQWKNW
jgi:hypothetical protein